MTERRYEIPVVVAAAGETDPRTPTLRSRSLRFEEK